MPTATAPGAPVSPAPTTPRPLLWTCAEFHLFGDMGVFEGRRAMLVNGVVLEQGPMNPPHALSLEMTGDAVRAAFGPGWRLRVQMPLVFGLHTDPMPDLAVLAGHPQGQVGHPTTAALVVEIADTSLRFDTTDKVEMYATAGIEDYWVVDLNNRRLLVFRAPAGNAYQTSLASAQGTPSPRWPPRLGRSPSPTCCRRPTLENSMSDIPAELRAKIVEKVEEGFDDRDQIIEYVAMDHNAEDGGGDITRAQLAPVVDMELLRHYERQLNWDEPTDCDRLDAAFADMEAQGLVARQNFT